MPIVTLVQLLRRLDYGYYRKDSMRLPCLNIFTVIISARKKANIIKTGRKMGDHPELSPAKIKCENITQISRNIDIEIVGYQIIH